MDAAIKVGFTGTRNGMTTLQKTNFTELIEGLSVTEFHHGDCVGADSESHCIVQSVPRGDEIEIHIHPPENDSLQARSSPYTALHLPCTYLARNRNIVNAVDLMVACPLTDHEVSHGGTWYTINYAKKVKKDVVILFPSGTIVWEVG